MVLAQALLEFQRAPTPHSASHICSPLTVYALLQVLHQLSVMLVPAGKIKGYPGLVTTLNAALC